MSSLTIKEINGETQIFEVNSTQVIYDNLEAQGKILPHGCLAGSCGACRIEVLEGLEFLSPAGAIETDTIQHLKSTHPQLADKNIRLSCRSKLLSNHAIIMKAT